MATNININQGKNSVSTMNWNSTNVCLVPFSASHDAHLSIYIGEIRPSKPMLRPKQEHPHQLTCLTDHFWNVSGFVALPPIGGAGHRYGLLVTFK
jgi:hypothetical protein